MTNKALYKKVKLSPAMRDAIIKMRSGLSLGYFSGIGSISEHAKIETCNKKMHLSTFRALKWNNLIRKRDQVRGDQFWELTELGKSISI